MPLKPQDTESVGPARDEGHFALLMDASGQRLAIRPGASLWLVEDKADASKILPLTLVKVRMNALTFRVPHPDGAVDYTYRLDKAKPLSKKALEKLVKHRDEAGKVPPKFHK